jgi:hypothetical protein
MKTYSAMNGSPGCLPDHHEIHTSYKSACDSCIEMLKIKGTRYAGALRRDGIVYFGKDSNRIGAGYAEVATGDNMTKEEFEKAQEIW